MRYSSFLNKRIKTVRAGYVAVSLVLCLLGILMIIRPETSTQFLCRAAGILLVVFGFVKIVGYLSKDLYRLAFQYDLACGILMITLGIIMICRPERIVVLFYSIAGILLLTDGLLKIQLSIDAKAFGIRQWWLILAFAILTGIFGVLLILRPISGASAVVTLLGISALCEGLLNLWVSLWTVRAFREENETVIDVDYTE